MARKIYIENLIPIPSVIIQNEIDPAPVGFTDITSIQNFFNYGIEYGLTEVETLSEIVALITDWTTHDAGEKQQVLEYIQQNHFTASITTEIRNDVSAPYLGFKIFNITTGKTEWWNGSTWTSNGGGTPEWFPTAITLGDGFTNRATLSLNSGAGIYIDFDASSDDEILFNISLDRNGLVYDGSDLKVELYWMKFGATGGSVKWELDYSFISIGDDAYTKIDGQIVKEVNVTALTNQNLTNTMFDVISGPVGSKVLQLTVRRNSKGAGADTYTGSAEVYGFNLEK
jgi:hypothetical protein